MRTKGFRRWKVVYILSLVQTLVIFFMMLYNREESEDDREIKPLPILYIVTPTFDRPVQIPELTRLMNALLHIENLHWIVVEDGPNILQSVKQLLESSSSISYTYLNAQETAPTRFRGRAQRNKGLEWIRKNHHPSYEGVFYFADDDNTYNIEIFHMMRKTKKVSVWPVGFIAGGRSLLLPFETAIVEKGKVVGFYSQSSYRRKFPLDMAAFAINVKVLFEYPDLIFKPDIPVGHLETSFLEQFCTPEELEPLADNCTRVLVWHTKTQKPPINKLVTDNIEWNVTKLVEKYKVDLSQYKRMNK